MKLFGPCSVAAFLAVLAVPAFADLSNAIFAYSPSGTQSLTLDTPSSPITLSASFTGWYDQTGFHSSGNRNYIAGVCGTDICSGFNLDTHDFFVFDLSSVAPGTMLTGASLSIGNALAPPGYISPSPTLTYDNWDVTTPISTLEASNSGAVGIYHDLGSGIMYASTIVSAADNGMHVGIALNADALAALTSAEGGHIAIGGAVELTSVPEPGFIGLVGAGLASLLYSRIAGF